jgi:hypothetical protein
MVDFEDKKYFIVVEPSVAQISGTARRTRIAAWDGRTQKWVSVARAWRSEAESPASRPLYPFDPTMAEPDLTRSVVVPVG